jgi:hypothetical protein
MQQSIDSMQRSIDEGKEGTRLLQEQIWQLRELVLNGQQQQQRAIAIIPIHTHGDEGGSLRGELAGAGMSTLPAIVGGWLH